MTTQQRNEHHFRLPNNEMPTPTKLSPGQTLLDRIWPTPPRPLTQMASVQESKDDAITSPVSSARRRIIINDDDEDDRPMVNNTPAVGKSPATAIAITESENDSDANFAVLMRPSQPITIGHQPTNQTMSNKQSRQPGPKRSKPSPLSVRPA